MDSPLVLMAYLLTSIISSWYMYIGFRQKNVAQCLIGIGWAIPSFGISQFNFWAIGAAVVFAGVWFQRNMDGM